MRNFGLPAIALLFTLSFASWSGAAMVDQVQFWTYDVPGMAGDGQVSLDFSNFDFSGATVSATLQYNIDNNAEWSDITRTILIPGGEHQIYLRLSTNTGIITGGDLSFLGRGGDYFGGATIAWKDYLDLTVAVAGADKFSPAEISGPAVPVPPAAFLLGSGLPGLFLLRRKKAMTAGLSAIPAG